MLDARAIASGTVCRVVQAVGAVTNFTVNWDAGQASTASTSIAYSRTIGPTSIELETGWHVAAPGPHAQHFVTVAVPPPDFRNEPLQPALPIEWIAVAPFALIVAADMTIRRVARFGRAPYM